MLSNHKIIRMLLILLMGMIMNIGYAQSSDPEEPSLLDPAEAVPVDGGLSLLLAAGVAYGIHKRRSPRINEGAKD